MTYCTNCGAERADANAPFCPSCNARVRKFTAPKVIPNYLVQSILVTFCCCQVAGVIGLIYAAQVNSKVQAGDIAGAQRASGLAKMWSIIGFAIGAALGLTYAGFVVWSIANS